MSPEIRQAYKIFRDLLNDKNKSITEPFLDAVDSTVPELSDYYDRIKEPIDLFKISEKFHMMEYKSITELAADLRQMIENCYRYNGFESFVSKQAYKLEILLEQKLALLSRELRSKTSIAATNIAKEKAYLNALLFTSGGRRLSRKPANGESSLILLQIQLQDELEEKDKKKQKEKEKKEHNEALEEELEEWWKKISNADFMTELSTTWEVPSVGIFIFVLKDLLNLQDLNYTEFELGTLFPQQSSLMAKIFTSLLVTPFQRSKLNHKDPMQYLIWEAKVNSKISSWYKMAYSRGQEYAASLFGFDPDLFDVLGYTNPFENLKYHQLPLRHRMWILKAFCEAALEQDSAMRDHFADLELLDRQDLCLGSDADGFSYHYFTSFGATDVRIYKQKANRVPDIPKMRDESRFIMKQEFTAKENKSSSKPLLIKKVLQMEEELVAKNNEKSVTIKEEQQHTRTSSRIRTKKSLSPPPLKATPVKKEKRPKKKAVEEFELVVSDIPSLSALVEKVANQLKIKGHRRNPEKDLHQTLEALHEELSKREASLLRCSQKAKLKVMLECKQESEDSAVHNAEKEKPQTCWGSDADDDDEDETESISEKRKPEVVDSSTALQLPQTISQLQDVNVAAACNFASPQLSEILSKEGRHLRKKRFDVKKLFSEHEQPRKRPKIDLAKSSSESRKDTTVSAAKSKEVKFVSTSSTNRKGLRSQSGSDLNGQERIIKQGWDDIVSERLQPEEPLCTKEGNCSVEGNSDFTGNVKHRSKPKKRQLSKHQSQRQEHELSAAEVAAIKLNRKMKNEEQTEKERPELNEHSPKPDSNTSYFTYDGLKALADIASLAQKHVIKASNSTNGDPTTDNEVDQSKKLKLDSDTSEHASHETDQISPGSQNNVILMSERRQRSADSPSSNGPEKLNATSCVNKEKQSIRITTSVAKFPMKKFVYGPTCSVKERPLIMQWKRPNILRKSKTVAAPTFEANSNADQKSTGHAEKVDQVSHSHSVTSTALDTVISPSVKIPSMTLSPSKTQTQDRISVFSKEKLALSSSNTSSSLVNVISKDGKYIICSNVQNASVTSLSRGTAIQTTRSVNSAMGMQALVQKEISVVVKQPVAQPLLTKTPTACPVVLLPATQQLFKQVTKPNDQPIVIPKRLVSNCQPERKVIVQQQGKTCVVTFQEQPVVSYACGISETVKEEASTKCPVTTLKSKLHAAALKKRCHYRGRLDSNSLYPVVIPQSSTNVQGKAIVEDVVISPGTVTTNNKSTIQIVKQIDTTTQVSQVIVTKASLSQKNREEHESTVSVNTISKQIEQYLPQLVSQTEAPSPKKILQKPTPSIVIVSPTNCKKIPSVNTSIKSLPKTNGKHTIPNQNYSKGTAAQRTKSIHIIKSSQRDSKNMVPKQTIASSTITNATQSFKQPTVSIVKQRPVNSVQGRRTSALQPIQPAIKPVTGPVKPNTIFIAPTGLALGATYQGAVPITPIPSHVLQISNSLPVASTISNDMRLKDLPMKPATSQIVFIPQLMQGQQSSIQAGKAISTTAITHMHLIATSSANQSAQPVKFASPLIPVSKQELVAANLPLQESKVCIPNNHDVLYPLVPESLKICERVSSTTVPVAQAIPDSTSSAICSSTRITNPYTRATQNITSAERTLTQSSSLTINSSARDVNSDKCFATGSSPTLLINKDAASIASENSSVTFSLVSPIPHAGVSSIQNLPIEDVNNEPTHA